MPSWAICSKMKRLEVSLASPIGPQIEARPPSRTMPIAALSALPPQISSKWLAFSLEPRAGTPDTRHVRSRTGMPMQRMCGAFVLTMYPASNQMVRDSKGVRPGKAVGMIPCQHQPGLIPVKPARVLQFRAVDDDLLV